MKRFLMQFRLYKYLREKYHWTSFYQKKLKKKLAIRKSRLHERAAKELKVLDEVFAGGDVVLNGPFKGMKYIHKSSGSALLPKVLGSYEEPIQGWVSEVLSYGYESILDIGCAEGYYAVGFGLRMPKTKIIAYDIDKQARKNCSELAHLNNVDNVEIKSECTHAELNIKSKKNNLVFCDIEGYEDVLLDPIKVPNLKNVDLIVESHDCFVPDMTEKLIKRFSSTHTISINVDYPFRVREYVLPQKVSEEKFRVIIDEHRGDPLMKFLFMKAKATL
jgi:hypothetical protein